MARERKEEADATTKLRYDKRTRPLSPISIATKVRIQEAILKLWSHVGVVVAVGRNRSYRIKFTSGSILRCNLWFIMPMIPAEVEVVGESPSLGELTQTSTEDAAMAAYHRTPTPSTEGPCHGSRIRKPKIIPSVKCFFVTPNSVVSLSRLFHSRRSTYL